MSPLRLILEKSLPNINVNKIMTKLLVIKIGYYLNYLIILGILIIPKTFCIWPPPYKITLSYEETFVIFDPIDKAELQDVYEEEMINREDMRNLKVESHDDKYYRIHRSLNNKNMKEENEEPVKKKKVFEEFNPDKEYPAPFKAGLVDDEKEFINDDVIYFDSGDDDEFRKRKRAEKLNSTNENYDYNNLKNQYDHELQQSEISNDTVNYTNVKEDESIKDSIKTLLKINMEPKNCTEEETKGIGLGAVECLWIDLNKPKLKNGVIEKIIRIIIIWFAVYLVIAIPLWCQYDVSFADLLNKLRKQNNFGHKILPELTTIRMEMLLNMNQLCMKNMPKKHWKIN